MMEEIQFRHDKQSIKHFFSQLEQLYTMYIYIYTIFYSLDFHDQKKTDEFHAT